MQLNITLGGSVNGTLIGTNYFQCNLVAGQSSGFTFVPNNTLLGQSLQFYFSGVGATGSTLSFTDCFGRSWTQQCTQVSGLIRRSVSNNGGTVQDFPSFTLLSGQVIPPYLVPTGNDTQGASGYLNPYSGIGEVDLTELLPAAGLVVEFYNAVLLNSGTINVSIT